ncbi:hypothetical protein BH23ACT12_BH23ACT12_02910 [soil metagenome]
MQPSLKRSRLVLMSLMVCGALFFATPAIAQAVLGAFTTSSSGTFSGAVTIPAGTAPGCYDLIAAGTGPVASTYPPTTTGGLTVSRTVVEAGDSITVAGSGFAPGTPVDVSLSARRSAQSMTIAQVSRILTARICVVAPGTGTGIGGGSVVINNDNRVTCTSNATATAAAYTIAQTGNVNINNNNTAKCESTASAVKNIETTPIAKPVTKILVRTGVDALPLLAAALATILLGSVLLSAGNRRGRFEGSLGSA